MAALTAFVALLACGAAAQIKGVADENVAQYTANAPNFQCLSGGVVIPFAQLNDNYCDCPDGSDEPGTSACANGKFYCENKGFKGTYIPSMHVGDGLCDCCDGSDEPSGVCENNCDVTARAARAAALENMKELQAGGAIKRLWLAEAAETVKTWQSQLQTATDEEAQLQKSVELKQAELDESKAADKANAPAPVEVSDPDEALAQSLQIANLTSTQLRSLLFALVRQTATSEDLVTLIKTTYFASSIVAADGGVDADGQGAEDTYTGPPVVWADNGKVQPLIPPSERTTALEGEVTKLKSDLAAKTAAKAGLDKDLQVDFGPDDAYLKLKGQCYEATVQKYKYTVCPFDNAKQDYTSLGQFSGFESEYSVMKFTGGSTCWNGPARSMTVTLKCGVETVLSEVSEPSTCAYVAVLRTPGACDLAALEQLEKEVAA